MAAHYMSRREFSARVAVLHQILEGKGDDFDAECEKAFGADLWRKARIDMNIIIDETRSRDLDNLDYLAVVHEGIPYVYADDREYDPEDEAHWTTFRLEPKAKHDALALRYNPKGLEPDFERKCIDEFGAEQWRDALELAENSKRIGIVSDLHQWSVRKEDTIR